MSLYIQTGFSTKRSARCNIQYAGFWMTFLAGEESQDTNFWGIQNGMNISNEKKIQKYQS